MAIFNRRKRLTRKEVIGPTLMNGDIWPDWEVPDRDVWPYDLKKFVEEIEGKAPGRWTEKELLKIDPSEYVFFREDLESELDSEARNPGQAKAQAALKAEQEERSVEIENQKEKEAARARTELVAEYNEEDDDDYFDDDQTEIEEVVVQRQVVVDRTEKKQLMHSPDERKKRTEENLEIVLDWLRLEPYSTIQVLSLVLRMGVPGTRRVLNKFVKEGFLVRDEIVWGGIPGKVHLFGISATAIMEPVADGEIQPNPAASFKRHKARFSTAPHNINIQLARLYYQRIQNPNNDNRHYTPTRYMPNFGLKDGKWAAYPDALIEQTQHKTSKPVVLAIEVEQHGKGEKRYKDLIFFHLRNIDKGRYDFVVYLLPTQRIVDNYRALFHRLIDKREIDEEKAKHQKQRFLFDTYSDLVERIQELD